MYLGIIGKDTSLDTMNSGISLKEQFGNYRAKFHRVSLWRGLLIWLGILVVSAAMLATTEYFFYFKATVKTTLFILWIGVLGYFTWVHILKHVLALFFGIGAISDRQIAVRIGRDNPHIEDKLVNFLELMSSSSIAPEYLSEVIVQKTKELSGTDFFSSIDKTRVVRAAWIAGLPTVLVMTYAAFDSHTIVEGSSRFFDYRTAYSPKAPFEFIVENDWTVEKGEDLKLLISVRGSSIPSHVNLWMNEEKIPMRKKEDGRFEWTLERVHHSEDLFFEAMGFRSDRYSIQVKEVPTLVDFVVTVVPPGYTGRAYFEYSGSKDALIPEGSELTWRMKWVDADSVFFLFDEDRRKAQLETGSWITSRRVKDSERYHVLGLNDNGTSFKTGDYRLNILKDARPTLKVEWAQDSVTGFVYLKGQAQDDYKVQSVFVTLTSESGEEERRMVNGYPANFDFVLAEKGWSSFYVTAVDNDGINGGKSAIVGPFKIDVLDQGEKREELGQRDRETVRNIERFQQRQQEAKEFRERLNQRMIDGSNEWQRAQMRNQVQQQQRELMDQWNEMKEDLQRQNEERLLNSEEEDELSEKRRQLQELLDNMDTEKLSELLRELEEQGDNMSEENLRDWMRQAERENQRMEMDAQRMEELMKRLNVEQQLNDVLEKLDELQDRQQELADSDTDSKEDQDALNEEFDELLEELAELKQDNDALESPMPIDIPEEKGESTQELMEESSEELGESESSSGDPSKANEKQQQSSDSMQEMMQNMSSSIMSMQMKMHIENRDNLRRILTNLVHLSDDQEGLLLEESDGMNSPDAVVVSWMRKQQDMLKAFEVVEDSLMAIAKRVPQVDAVVTQWLVQVRDEMDRSNATMSEREMPQANSSMRESMLALNELANLIDGVMDQIQQQMAAGMPGNQQCEKPGGSSPSMSNLRMRQQQLSEQMQQMGQSPGNKEGEGQNENSSQGSGEGQRGRGDAQQIVEMMSRQAQIREMLKEAGSTGNNGDKSLEELLEENERDLLRRNFDADFFDRQKEIEVRMLELEEAERLQEQEDQRQSNTGDRYQLLREQYLEEFLRQNRNRREDFRFDTPMLTPYYRERSSSYLRNP